jgi:hypothetical protein
MHEFYIKRDFYLVLIKQLYELRSDQKPLA